MDTIRKLDAFSESQLQTVNQAVAMAEELVSDYYKMSASQWLKPKYDIKTLAALEPREIVEGPFAQIIRYQGKRKDSPLGSESYDYYKICLQDQTILKAVREKPELDLLAFCIYIIVHELIHIVRFSRFLQNFNASDEEKLEEERRVHEITHQILTTVRTAGVPAVLAFYHNWRLPFEDLDPMQS